MNSSCMSRSPIKDNQKTNLSINKQSPIPKNPKKSKSQINIRKKYHLQNLNQQLESLKQKIQVSKDILSTIYSKVKNKQSQYDNQISQKDLHLHRSKQMISDYKILYESGLKDMENFVDRNRVETLSKNQQYFSKAKLQELKRNAQQKIKDKRSVEIQQPQIINQQEKQINLSKSAIKKSTVDKRPGQTPNPIQKMKKSHSAIYHQKTKSQFQKIPTSKQNKLKKQKQTINKQKQRKQFFLAQEKPNEKQKQTSKIVQSKLTHFYKKQQPNDDKKSLYEIYKDRILKREKQQNSQKMNWIVEKLQQNINDLQLIRKKSQLKLSKYSPQFQNHSLAKKTKIQNAESFDRKQRQDKSKLSKIPQKMKRQKSKQKYLEIQKNKLKKIDQSISK